MSANIERKSYESEAALRWGMVKANIKTAAGSCGHALVNRVTSCNILLLYIMNHVWWHDIFMLKRMNFLYFYWTFIHSHWLLSLPLQNYEQVWSTVWTTVNNLTTIKTFLQTGRTWDGPWCQNGHHLGPKITSYTQGTYELVSPLVRQICYEFHIWSTYDSRYSKNTFLLTGHIRSGPWCQNGKWVQMGPNFYPIFRGHIYKCYP